MNHPMCDGIFRVVLIWHFLENVDTFSKPRLGLAPGVSRVIVLVPSCTYLLFICLKRRNKNKECKIAGTQACCPYWCFVTGVLRTFLMRWNCVISSCRVLWLLQDQLPHDLVRVDLLFQKAVEAGIKIEVNLWDVLVSLAFSFTLMYWNSSW